MKFLIVPASNSFSHVTKALAIRAGLIERGHDVLIAIGRHWQPYLTALAIPCAIVADIQESDGIGFPGVDWFRDRHAMGEVIDEERRLIAAFRPDRVIGVFRFTLKAAARQARLPYLALTCGCMSPGAWEGLGYAPEEPGAGQQQALMSGFFRYAGRRISQTTTELGLPPLADAREMLAGDRTFLWDFPEFFAPAERPGCLHVGPIFWRQWPVVDSDWHDFATGLDRPRAVLSFGTCVGNRAVAHRLATTLGNLGFHVLLAAGGQQELFADLPAAAWLTVCNFAPLHLLWPKVRLLVSHGGQMSIFEALSHGVPVAVMPFQPEQAHNGVCLERLGCGRRLIPGQPFLGQPAVYQDALLSLDDTTLAGLLAGLLDEATASRVAATRQIMRGYPGLPALLPELEAG
jgi:UDP:flavonoid glycosyltransferase YjiC (YdhE family)